MAFMWWISLCVLVISSAIPLLKKEKVKETDDINVVWTEDNGDKVTNKVTDLTSAALPVSSEGDYEAINTTEGQQEVTKDEVFAILNRQENVTRKLHSGIRRIYHSYRPGNMSTKHIHAISSVHHYMVKTFPSLHSSNKTFHAGKIMATKAKQKKAKNSTHIYKNQDVTRNITADQVQYKKKKQQRIQDGDKQEEVVMNNEVDRTQMTSNTDSLFGLINSSTLDDQDVTSQPMISCQHVAGFYEPRWLHLVVLCPGHWTDSNIKSQCESWEHLNTLTFMDEVTFLPVQDENGTIYANVYCAMCHSVSYFLPWTTRFVCDKDSPDTLLVSDFSDLTSLYTYLLSSKCERQIIPSMPEAVQKCEKGPLAVSLSARKSSSPEIDSIPSSYPISFNVLMNFDFTGNTHILFTASQSVIQEEYIPRCEDGKTYDPYIQGCRQITCSKFYTLVDNTCVRNDGDATSTDGITDLSQLRTVNIVTLQVNITFGDFLVMKFKDIEPEIVPQIADHLNISVDRLKDLNITYELGSINGSALEVTTLTEKEYGNLFPHHPSQNLTSTVPHFLGKFWQSDSDAVVSTSGPLEEESVDTNSNYDDDIEHKKTATESSANDRLKGGKITPEVNNAYTIESTASIFNMNTTSSQTNTSADHKNDGRMMPTQKKNIRQWSSQLASMGQTTKDHRPSTGGSAWLNELTSNSSTHNLGLNKKLFKEVYKYHGTLVSTQYENFFRYRFQSQNNTDLYISAPINDQSERICLLVKDSQSLQLLLSRGMVMRISFALVASDDPMSNEAASKALLQKIGNLIVEQQFSLKLNGNNVDVVAMDNDRDETIDETEFCPWGVEYMVYNDEFMLVTMDNSTLMYVNNTNSYVGVGLFDLYVFVSGSNNAEQTNVTGLMQYAFVCFMPRISENCNRINLEKKEYFVVGDNKSIIFEGKEYDIFEYRVVDEITGTIQICVPSTFNDHDKTILPHVVTIENGCSKDFGGALSAEGYMTLVLGRFSTFALSFVILTYLLFPTLHNLPGLNTMSLTSCLLVTQIIFAEGIGENRHWLCKTVAISLHYTLLAAHFWMNVMSYDVYKTFTNRGIMTHARERSKYFIRYALYAFGAPFIIVSLCVFVDFSDLFDGVSIGYGYAPSSSANGCSFSYHNGTYIMLEDVASINNTSLADEQRIHSCWITQPLAALVAFGSIILIIFLVNCILFGKTIMSISRTAKIAKKSLTTRHSNSSFHKVSEHSEVMLYVKMSTVMGFTWVFGLSSSILSSFVNLPTYTACAVIHVLVILFIILNTSQGIFIFVAFVCNRRVFGLYKGLIQKAKNFIGHSRSGDPYVIGSNNSSSPHQTSGHSK